jgi:uncharacterized protein DUF3224
MRIKSRFAALVIPLVALLVMATPLGASAAPPVEASGNYAATSTTINGVRLAGPNAIIDLTFTVSYTGTLAGTSVFDGRLAAHPNDAGNFHGVETFTGTVNGAAGTLTFNVASRHDPSGASHDKAVIRRGTGGLAGLHGVLFQEGTVGPLGPLGSYSGRIG